MASGATGSVFAISNAPTNDAGSYSLIITNAYGSVTSSNALLTVAPTRPLTPGNVISWRIQVIPNVAPGTRFTKIAAGFDHSLALKSDGTVVAWGGNFHGQSTVPVGLNGVVAIAAGTYHSLALIAGTNQNIAPAIVVQASGNNVLLSWPLSAQDFALQSTTNLTDKNSWTTLTNSPVIVDSQNRVTDTISGPAKFYRLKKEHSFRKAKRSRNFPEKSWRDLE